MQAEINIIGIIDTKENGGVDLLNVISQVSALQKQGEIENLIVNIDSLGGDVEIGKSIHAYLKGLKIPVITTVALNQCCSIATIIHLAGNVRKVQSNCTYLIHLPLIDYAGGINTNDLDAMRSVLSEVENDLAGYYQEISRIDKNAILSLMRNETILSPEDLVNLGFAHEIIQTNESKLLNIKAIATNSKDPLWDFNVWTTLERPNPVPLPTGFVVKKGSFTRARISGDIPHPVSDIVTSTVVVV